MNFKLYVSLTLNREPKCVGIVTRRPHGRPNNWGLILGSGSVFSLLDNILTDSAAHPGCRPVGIGGSFPWDIKQG